MWTYLWTGPIFVHYTMEKELYSETADPTLINSLDKKGWYNKGSSLPISYK